MSDLSPAAEAVANAYAEHADPYAFETLSLAAALRAAADIVVKPTEEHYLGEWTIRKKLLAIATELEAQ